MSIESLAVVAERQIKNLRIYDSNNVKQYGISADAPINFILYFSQTYNSLNMGMNISDYYEQVMEALIYITMGYSKPPTRMNAAVFNITMQYVKKQHFSLCIQEVKNKLSNIFN